MDGRSGINCSVYRNEGPRRSSELLVAAMEMAFRRWPAIRDYYTFVDGAAVQSRNPGYCFQCAGWRRAGLTKRGLTILEFTRPCSASPTPAPG